MAQIIPVHLQAKSWLYRRVTKDGNG